MDRSAFNYAVGKSKAMNTVLYSPPTVNLDHSNKFHVQIDHDVIAPYMHAGEPLMAAPGGGDDNAGRVIVTDMSVDERGRMDDERRQIERERGEIKRERARIDKVSVKSQGRFHQQSLIDSAQ